MRQYTWEKGEDSQDSQDDDFFDDEVSSRSIQKRTKRGRYAEDDPAESMTVLHVPRPRPWMEVISMTKNG